MKGQTIVTRSVVVTALCTINALGESGTEEHDNLLLSGNNGFRPITLYNVENCYCKVAGEFKGYPTIPPSMRRLGRGQAMTSYCSNRLAMNSDWNPNFYDPWRVGEFHGADFGVIDLEDWMKMVPDMLNTDRRDGVLCDKANFPIACRNNLSQSFITRLMSQAHKHRVSKQFMAKGAGWTCGEACAASAISLIEAYKAIARYDLDAAFVGGTSCQVNHFHAAGFEGLGVMSKQGQHRSFLQGRDGFVPGEAVGILILEAEEMARERGAKPIAEFLGGGICCDAASITDPDPEGYARALELAAKDAQITADEVGYFNGHGSATHKGDEAEAEGLRLFFKEHLGDIPVSSCKTQVGHTLHACSVVETALTLIALQHGFLPPNGEEANPKSGCQGLQLAGVGDRLEKKVIGKGSMGFSGTNAAFFLRMLD